MPQVDHARAASSPGCEVVRCHPVAPKHLAKRQRGGVGDHVRDGRGHEPENLQSLVELVAQYSNTPQRGSWRLSEHSPCARNCNFHSSCTLSGTSETDVVWTQANLVNGILAQTSCDNFDILSEQCDQNYIKIDWDEVNEGNNDEIDQTITTCHELGNTAGLSHGSTQNDCMENVDSINPPTALKWRRYSSHHINDHINS